MATSTRWQLARDAALRYEQILVPAILGPAAASLVEFAAPRSGTAVLDVGCGTGAAARRAAERVGRSGRVAGVDVNPGMIEVARSLSPVEGAAIEWLEGSAGELPFAEAAFDLVLCAQTLQFLDDRRRALEEMHRVLSPGGRLALSLWCELPASPYFEALVEAITRHVGPDTAVGLRAAFGLSDIDLVRALVEEAGFRDVEAEIGELDLPLPPLEDFAPRHISATPMAEGFRNAPAEAQQAVIRDMAERLASYRTPDGLLVPFRTHLVQARKAGRSATR
jgi:SAM-dependent methyltransferase